jgi:hypothetical protein
MKSDNDLKKRSGAELRALREQRSAPVSSRQQRLDAYREVIVRRQRDFVETGTALGLIAKEGLYVEAGFASFEAMVTDEFDMSRPTAYRLIDAARVVTILSQVGTVEKKIRNQSQALALAPLGKDREAMVLTIAAAEARGRITADLLADVRVELYPHTKVIDGEVVDGRSPLVAGMRAAIEGVADKQKQTSPGPAGSVDGEEDAANLGGRAVSSEPPTSGPVATSPGDGSGGTAAAPGLRAADEEPQVRAGLSERGSSAASGGVPSVAAGGNPQAGPGNSAPDSGVPGPAADDGASADRPSSAAPDHRDAMPGGTAEDAPRDSGSAGEAADPAESAETGSEVPASWTSDPVTPTNHRGRPPGDAAADAGMRADVDGDETGPEVPPLGAPASAPVDGREWRATTGVSVPAAPGPVELPQWLRAVSAVVAAIHELDNEDPEAVAQVIPEDLAEELGVTYDLLHDWYLRMRDHTP